MEYRLIITDSIGVENGDPDYILGWPVNPTHSPEGNITFVDRMKHAVFIYAPDGTFVRSIGREGEGPGEFQMPTGVAFRSDGSLLIRDGNSITLFDSSCEYVDRMAWPFSPPYLLTALDNGGFIGEMRTPAPVDNGVLWVSTLAQWDDGEEDPSVEYSSIEYEWNVESVGDISSSRGSTMYSCAAGNGRVFYSRSSIDEFEIHGCEPDGTPFLHIEDPDTYRVSKSEDELRMEMDNFSSFLNRMSGGSSGDIPIEPDPYRHTVLGMFMDGEDRLWVRLGCYTGIVFRVYDMNGEVLFHAMVEYHGDPVDLMSWEITGDEHGFLGYDPFQDQYQRIYILALVEAGQTSDNEFAGPE